MDEAIAPATKEQADRGKWTEAQFSAITSRDKTLLLSAAAGSGKTSTLTERVIRMLTDPDDPHDVTRMVIVTFTVAAANELKDKLSAALTEAIRRDPSDRRLPEQLLLLADADIGTIDSFCRRIVAEFSDCTDLSPNYRVCGASEESQLRRSVLDQYIDRLFAGKEDGVASAEDFCEFASQVVESKHQDDLAKIILEASKAVENFPEGVDKLDVFAGYVNDAVSLPPEKTEFGRALLRMTADVFRDVETAAEEALSALDGEPELTKTTLEPLLFGALTVSRAIADPAAPFDAVRDLLSEAKELKIPAFKSNARFCKDATPEVLLAAKEALYNFRDQGRSLRDGLFSASSDDWKTEAEAHRSISELFARLIRRFEQLVKEEKKRRNVASFADVARAALRLLVDPKTGKKTAVAREIASRYDAVFVDEYQDVNRIQHAIFEAISGERNRFLVGDIKQSIYRFRRADPSIFVGLKRAFPPLSQAGNGPSATIFLSENFRCDKPIVDFVNGVFDQLFGAAGESIGYVSDDRLRFAKPESKCNPAAPLPVVRMFRSPKEEPDVVKPDPESEWVAEEIERLLERETLADGSPIKPEDVVILLRKAKHTPLFRSALEKRGIPVSVEIKENLFESPEIRLALCLLSVVDNPRRDVPLVGLLLSPLYDGFTPDLLTEIRDGASLYGEPFYDALIEYVDKHDFAPGKRFIEQLESFRRAAEGTSVDRLILKIFTETGLLPIGGAANPSNGRENLLLFYQFARSFEAASFRGLYRFIAYINDLAAQGDSPDLQPPTTAGGVKIMTIHHSKGLERPVVFLARTPDRADSIPLTTDRNVSFDARFGLTAKVRNPGTGLARIETPFRLIADREDKRLDREEALCLLYVALTRARERLYVTASLPNNASVASRRALYAKTGPLTRSEVLGTGSLINLIARAVGGEDATLAQLILPDDEAENPAGTDAVATERPVADEKKEPEKALSPRRVRADDGAVLTDEQAVELLEERFAYRYEFPWLGTVPGKLSVSALSPSVLDGADEGTATLLPKKRRKEPALPSFLSGKTRTDDPALRGTATHEFLQFCDPALLRKNGAKVELDRLIGGGFLAKETRDLVNLDELELFRASSLLDEMLSASWMRRELRFNMIMPASNFTTNAEHKERLKDQTVLVQGVMDCAFVTKTGELVLLDYKTDRLRGAPDASDAEIGAFVDRHRDQLRYYAIAIEKMLGRMPDRVLLYPLCLGRAVEVAL